MTTVNTIASPVVIEAKKAEKYARFVHGRKQTDKVVLIRQDIARAEWQDEDVLLDKRDENPDLFVWATVEAEA